MIISCPFCLTRVQPTPQGRCPACLREVTGAAEAPRAGQQPEFSDWTVVSEPAPAESDYEQVVRFFALMDRLTPRVWVTPTLIAINAVVFLGLLLASGSLSPRANVVLEWGANFGPKTLDGQWWRLFSAVFLHFGILHVALNMWALWNLGQLVERLTGNVGFLILYLVSGAAGCVASLAWNPDVLGAGASGAVFGVGGALAGFLATRRDSIPLVLLSRLRSSMLGFIVINVVLGFMIPFIDNAAHLGGLAAGFLCGLGLSQPIGPEMARGRLLRNVLVAMAGGLLLGLAFHFLPAPPPDIESELTVFSMDEGNLLETHKEVMARADKGTLTPAQAADAIEMKLLPLCRQWRTRLAELETAPRANPEGIRRVEHYLQLRQESWEALAEGLRNNDQAAFQRFKEKWEAADDLAAESRASRRK